MNSRPTNTRKTRRKAGRNAAGPVVRGEALQVAARLFAENGYRATSLELVAERLNITRQALYYHFENKADVLGALFDDLMTKLEIAAADASAEPAETRLVAMLQGHLAVITTNTDLVAILLHERPEIAKIAGLQAAKRRRAYSNSLVAAYRAGVAAGRLRDMDPRVAVDTLITAANGTSSWFHPTDGVSIEAVSAAVLELLIHGITRGEAETG